MSPEFPELPRVLVVDDIPATVITTRTLLMALGYEVEICIRARDCLATARRFKPDVVLMDIAMPEMDGIELARQLRAATDIPPCKLVAVTGYGSEEIQERCREAHFSAFLLKPATVDQLRAALRKDAPAKE